MATKPTDDAIQSTKKLEMEKLMEAIRSGKKKIVMPDLSPQLEARLKKLLLKVKNKKDNNPDVVPSTKPPVKGPEGPKKPTLRGRFIENSEPVEKKKGGEVKKKSKKSGRLALRGYGKSR